MIGLQDWMTSPPARALGWALVHFLWQGAVIALLLAVALSFTRAARVRYVLACAALLVMAGSFAATMAICWPPDVPVRKIAFSAPPPVLRLPAAPDPAGRSALDNLRESAPPAWFVPVWLAGVSLFYCYSLAAWLAATRLKRRGTVPAPELWRRRVQSLVARMGLRRPVLLLESCLVDVPVMIGYLRPVILLPLGMLAGLRSEEVEAILIHELAHIRRYDYLVNLIQTVVEGLLFYHPAVWWTGQVIRREREHCCDDVVVALHGDARGYAATLARLELSRAAVRDPVLAATGGNLMKRIHRLMQQPEGPRGASPVVCAAVLLATGTLAVAAWQAQPAPQSAPQTAQAPVPLPAAVPAAQAQQQPQPEHHLVEPLPQHFVEPIPQTPREARDAALRQQLETPYRKWLNEDVAYIITDAERSAFKQLTTDSDHEQFIEQFWLRRDPTPGTIENEMKEEHYRRIAYANEHFASGIPGWKTDRGRVYITYGPPDEIEDHSSGGIYERPPSEGGGAITTYPFQQWLYKYIEGVGKNVIIEFVDSTHTGEYHMTMDPTEKDLLLHPSGTPPLYIAASVGSPVQSMGRGITGSYEVQPRPVVLSIPLNSQGHSSQVIARVTTPDGKGVANSIDIADGSSSFTPPKFLLVPGLYIISVTVKDRVTGVSQYGSLTLKVD